VRSAKPPFVRERYLVIRTVAATMKDVNELFGWCTAKCY